MEVILRRAAVALVTGVAIHALMSHWGGRAGLTTWLWPCIVTLLVFAFARFFRADAQAQWVGDTSYGAGRKACTVVLYAVAVGMTVLVSRISGVNETIATGITGFIATLFAIWAWWGKFRPRPPVNDSQGAVGTP